MTEQTPHFCFDADDRVECFCPEAKDHPECFDDTVHYGSLPARPLTSATSDDAGDSRG